MRRWVVQSAATPQSTTGRIITEPPPPTMDSKHVLNILYHLITPYTQFQGSGQRPCRALTLCLRREETQESDNRNPQHTDQAVRRAPGATMPAEPVYRQSLATGSASCCDLSRDRPQVAMADTGLQGTGHCPALVLQAPAHPGCRQDSSASSTFCSGCTQSEHIRAPSREET